LTLWETLARWIGDDGRAALVRIVSHQGSSPREAGASLILRKDGRFSGTIGGGALEYLVLDGVRTMLAEPPAGRVVRHVLGPSLGQCCGGTVEVRMEVFSRVDLDWIGPLAAAGGDLVTTMGQPDAAGRLIRRPAGSASADGGIVETFGVRRTPVMLCGAGHVGRALVMALAPLPFAVTWVDPRADAFPDHVPAGVRVVAADPVATLEEAAPGTMLAVFTHSHPLDLALVSRALPDSRFAYVGLIGSATKRARFLSQMQQAGIGEPALGRLVCPIGGRAADDKHPAVIAALVAAELLQARAQAGSGLCR